MGATIFCTLQKNHTVYNMFINFEWTIASTKLLLLFLAFPSVFMTVRVASAQESPRSCIPVGRVEAGTSDNYRQRGAIVCSGSQILNPVNIELWCFASRSSVRLNGDTLTADSACSDQISESDSTVCSGEGVNPSLCFRPKTPVTRQFQILQPDVISGPTPLIEWELVPQAQSYTVYIVGPDVEWQQTTASDQTSLNYPATESPLTIGTAYEIVITANQDDQITASASTVVNIRDTVSQHLNLQLATRTNGAQ